MRIGVYLALGGALVLCLLAHRSARRLGPRLAALTLSVSAVLAAAMWVWNLVLLAGTLIGRLGYVARMGHWSGRALAVHDPVPVAAAFVAALLVLAAAVGLAACGQRVGRELWRIWSAARACPVTTADRLVVVDDPAVRAVAVPGVHGRVVITTGMVRALSAAERKVLLAHERAHLRYRHGEIRLATRLAAAVMPLVRPLVKDCDYQLERCADEAAAHAVGDRGLTAQALARAALAGRPRTIRLPAAVPGFAERSVTSRVQALLAEPTGDQLWRLAGPLTVLAITATLSIEAGRDLEALFELAMRVWSG
ncbi:MAG: M48 family metalloprotease [Mycobacteriales bacterium]